MKHGSTSTPLEYSGALADAMKKGHQLGLGNPVVLPFPHILGSVDFDRVFSSAGIEEVVIQLEQNSTSRRGTREQVKNLVRKAYILGLGDSYLERGNAVNASAAYKELGLMEDPS